MAKQKNLGVRDALANDADLHGTFYFSDAASKVPGQLRFSISIRSVTGEVEQSDIPIDADGAPSLTAANRAALKGLLKKVAADAFTAAGYVDI